MPVKRHGEEGNFPFRSGRFYSVGSDWFAMTREGYELGPFRSREEAKMAVAAYVAEHSKAEAQSTASELSQESDSIEARVQELREFMRVREEQGVAAALQWAKDRVIRFQVEPLPPSEREDRLAALNYLIEHH